ncbi:MAG: STAS/SEC14 domain-containing protein [Verrucomicrobia bacterium]|nr:STAS/SEC14 domain-containing protein [Cytophagales bacterium]
MIIKTENDFLKEILYDDHAMCMLWNERENMIEVLWAGSVCNQEYNQYCDKVIEHCLLKENSKLVMDMRKMKTDIIKSKIQIEWLPVFIAKTKIRRQAFVSTELTEVLSQLELINSMFQGIFEVAVFNCHLKALQWIS